MSRRFFQVQVHVKHESLYLILIQQNRRFCSIVNEQNMNPTKKIQRKVLDSMQKKVQKSKVNPPSPPVQLTVQYATACLYVLISIKDQNMVERWKKESVMYSSPGHFVYTLFFTKGNLGDIYYLGVSSAMKVVITSWEEPLLFIVSYSLPCD